MRVKMLVKKARKNILCYVSFFKDSGEEIHLTHKPDLKAPYTATLLKQVWRGGYRYRCHPNYVESLVDYVREDEDLGNVTYEVDPKSLTHFYGYMQDGDWHCDWNLEVELTERLLHKATQGYMLMRLEVNKERWTNMMGWQLPIFQHTLFYHSPGYNYTSVSSRLDKYEMGHLLGFFGDYAPEHRKILERELEAMAAAEDKDRIKTLKEIYNSYVQKVRELADSFKHVIVDDPKVLQARREDGMRLDCGFSYLYTDNEDFNAAASALEKIPHDDGVYYRDHIDVAIPYPSQSMTLQGAQYDIIVKRLNEAMPDTFRLSQIID